MTELCTAMMLSMLRTAEGKMRIRLQREDAQRPLRRCVRWRQHRTCTASVSLLLRRLCAAGTGARARGREERRGERGEDERAEGCGCGAAELRSVWLAGELES